MRPSTDTADCYIASINWDWEPMCQSKDLEWTGLLKHKRCTWSPGIAEALCMIVTKIGLPPLQWIFIHSLGFEDLSQMDKKLLRNRPLLLDLLHWLGTMPQFCLGSVLGISAINILALGIAMRWSRSSSTSSIITHYEDLWSLAMVFLTALWWAYEEGSAFDFFLVAMPMALSIGISLTLLQQSFRYARPLKSVDLTPVDMI